MKKEIQGLVLVIIAFLFEKNELLYEQYNTHLEKGYFLFTVKITLKNNFFPFEFAVSLKGGVLYTTRIFIHKI